MNMAQGRNLAAVIGAGTSFSTTTGAFTTPSFVIGGTTYHSVGTALAAVNTRLNALASGASVSVPQPMQVAPVELEAPMGEATTLSQVQAHAAAGDAQTLSSAQAHADAGDVQTLATANEYADSTATATLRTANAYADQRMSALNDDFLQFQGQVDARFIHADERMNKLSAMSGASAQMAAHALSGGQGRGRLSVGLGFQSGEKAVSLGYGKRVGATTFSLGAAFGGGETQATAGFGFDL